MTDSPSPTLRFAEFFAGIGLVRLGLEQAGMHCVFANDFDESKNAIYTANFSKEHLLEGTQGDIYKIHAYQVPAVDLATASFPCQNLSVAGDRQGLAGERSKAFHEFARILSEWKHIGRLPRGVLIENVVGLLSSHQGRDITSILETLTQLGYACDVLVVDAARFVPQSRRRVFIVGLLNDQLGEGLPTAEALKHPCRPSLVKRVISSNPHVCWRFLALPTLPADRSQQLADLVEMDPHVTWFDDVELQRQNSYIRDKNPARVQAMRDEARRSGRAQYRTAYRRMRNKLVCLEVRNDELSGCLRTPTGGSSRQILLEARPDGSVRMRYMTAREYARLQGVADNFQIPDKEWLGLHAFGDAVAVPVVKWLGHVLNRELIRTT